MDFKDLQSEETLQHALAWISSYIQGAIEDKQPNVVFTFTPNQDNPIMEIFEFTLKLKDILHGYGFSTWCILDNKNQKVRMKIIV